LASAFPGFSTEALQFFRSLARNNNREWFLPRKPVFEQHVKQPMYELVNRLNSAMTRFAPEYLTEPSKAVYRFYRDTRFSKDKSPYKTHIAASFRNRHLGGEAAGGGFYFAVSHKEVAVGGGMYMPSPETLLAVRRHLAQNHKEFRKILASKPVRNLLGEVQGERLTRVPKGFCAEDPAADFLKHKQLYLYIELPPELAMGTKLENEIVTRFKAMTPFLQFLNAPLPKEKKPKIDPRELLI
jgi:uncharacterized protein (TIGR02453 family)